MLFQTHSFSYKKTKNPQKEEKNTSKPPKAQNQITQIFNEIKNTK